MPERMRIVFLSNANSLHLREWAEYFARDLGHAVTVLTIPPLERPYSGAVEVIEIGAGVTRHKLFWPLLVPRIRREVAARRADLLVGYRVVSYGFLAALTGIRPLVLAAQGGDMVWPPGDRLGQACVRYAVRRADLLNAWSENIRVEMLRYGADPSRIVVLSRGIDLTFFPTLPVKAPHPPRIAMTRSLLPSYNTKQLVEAMPHVLRELPDARCDIAGDGPLRGALEQQARDLGIAGPVRFVGRLSREEVRALVGGAHVYASTTITDGLPLSHFEAMAVGAVPVCTDIAANRLWIRDGENGYLAPVGDAPALAERLVRALRDHDWRGRAMRANRALVEREHDRQVNLARMEGLWRDLCRRRGGAAVTAGSTSSSVG